MINVEPNNIPLPEGYTSWLDYAVDTLDTRALEVQNLFNDVPGAGRDQILAAARNELRELRAKAADSGLESR